MTQSKSRQLSLCPGLEIPPKSALQKARDYHTCLCCNAFSSKTETFASIAPEGIAFCGNLEYPELLSIFPLSNIRPMCKITVHVSLSEEIIHQTRTNASLDKKIKN